MDFVGFSFFIHPLLGMPILNLQSFLYPSEPTKFSYSHFELTKFLSMNFHVVCLHGTFIRELLAQLHMYWLYFSEARMVFICFVHYGDEYKQWVSTKTASTWDPFPQEEAIGLLLRK